MLGWLLDTIFGSSNRTNNAARIREEASRNAKRELDGEIDNSSLNKKQSWPGDYYRQRKDLSKTIIESDRLREDNVESIFKKIRRN
jgi:hypothetical protein